MPPGETGEIIVTGPTVTKEYDQLPDATALAKIQTPGFKIQTNGREQITPDSPGTRPAEFGGSAPSGAVWHRLGDAGRLDADGRLWFCGRIVERVETASGVLHTEPCEQVFRGHSLVARCALIGLGPPGRQEPALVVQPAFNSPDKLALARELRKLAVQSPHTAGIKKFFFRAAFPVDVRHNAKIHRLTLTKWAITATAIEPEQA